MIASEDQAYKMLALTVLDFIKDRSWTKGFCRCSIYAGMVKSEQWLEINDVIDEKALGWPRSDLSPSEATEFLRDDLVKKTGDKIWGLTFTLHPNGKFNIEYDYNKPADYEETDDVITGDEINQSIGGLKK